MRVVKAISSAYSWVMQQVIEYRYLQARGGAVLKRCMVCHKPTLFYADAVAQGADLICLDCFDSLNNSNHAQADSQTICGCQHCAQG